MYSCQSRLTHDKYLSLLQNIVSFIGLFPVHRDLYYVRPDLYYVTYIKFILSYLTLYYVRLKHNISHTI